MAAFGTVTTVTFSNGPKPERIFGAQKSVLIRRVIAKISIYCWIKAGVFLSCGSAPSKVSKVTPSFQSLKTYQTGLPGRVVSMKPTQLRVEHTQLKEASISI